MDEFVKTANKALDEQKWVRIHNSYEDGTTKLVVNGKTVMVLRDTIVYPGFINCTQVGTPCRIVKATKGLGFGSERAKGWSDYHLEISNEYNSYDVIAEDEDPYYGSDRYFEDGFEAGYYC